MKIKKLNIYYIDFMKYGKEVLKLYFNYYYCWRDYYWIFDVIKYGLFVLFVFNVFFIIGFRW